MLLGACLMWLAACDRGAAARCRASTDNLTLELQAQDWAAAHRSVDGISRHCRISPEAATSLHADVDARHGDADAQRLHAEEARQRLERDRLAAQSAAQAAAKAEIVARFAGMSAAGRASAITAKCGHSTACPNAESDAVVEAAASAEERKQLTAAIARLVGAEEKSAEIAARKKYASSLEIDLLDRHMNPDSVSASGPNATVLSVSGWFCSRQFVYDMQRSSRYDDIKALGFKRVVCWTAFATDSFDL